MRAIAGLRVAQTAEAQAAALRVAMQQGARVLASAWAAERLRATSPGCIAGAEQSALVEFFLRERQGRVAGGLAEMLLRTLFRRRVLEL